MKIQIKSLTLVNFKGIRNKEIMFNPDGQTFIYGNNATGKTTIFDSWTWLLFGKDSQGRTDFEIKTLNQDSTPIEKLDHEVTGVLLIDNKETTIKRVLREKWVKKRGSESTEFEGNETLLFINNVPKKANEFKEYINSLIDENIFKLITSPLAFNSLKWEERRKILVYIAPAISNGLIVSEMDIDNDRKQTLLNLIAGDQSLSEQKKALAAKIKQFKGELKTIPTRIDEVERSKPDLTNIDLTNIDNDIELYRKELIGIDNQIANKSKAFEAQSENINAKRKQLFDLQAKIQNRENELKLQADNELREKNRIPLQLQSEVDNIKSQIEIKQKEKDRKIEMHKLANEQIERVQKEIQSKRDEWVKVDSEVFKYDPTSLCCPTCNQELKDKDAKIESLKANFNTNKSNKLEQISLDGHALKNKLISLQDESKKYLSESEEILKEIEILIGQKKSKTEELIKSKQTTSTQINIEDVTRKPDNDVELMHSKNNEKQLMNEIAELTAKLGTVDNEELINTKAKVNSEIDRLKAIKQKMDEVAKANNRINELKESETKLAREQAKLERNEFLINQFNKSSIEYLESKVNSMFELVKFKMFDQQINGGESETCVCTVNGVPFPDLNNAMKIQAGLDIIKTLSDFYKLSAPIFIDNRESVVNIGEQTAQIVNLIVSPEDNELRIV